MILLDVGSAADEGVRFLCSPYAFVLTANPWKTVSLEVVQSRADIGDQCVSCIRVDPAEKDVQPDAESCTSELSLCNSLKPNVVEKACKPKAGC